MNKHILLKSVPAFSRLTEDQLRVLAASMGTQTFERGETIFHQGSIGSVLYIIVTGQVRIYTISQAGQELSVKVFCDGDFFGEMALLDGQPRAASAEAMVSTTSLTLHRATFLHTINTYPPIAASILEVMAARLRQSNTYAEQLAGLTAAQRVMRQLLELALRRAARIVNGPEEVRVEVDLTQDDLASLSGTTRETVNRVLSGLRDQGLIRIERARISVLDLPRMQALLDII